MSKASVSTIGFTQTTAEGFFDRLLKAAVKKSLTFDCTTPLNWRVLRKRKISPIS